MATCQNIPLHKWPCGWPRGWFMCVIPSVELCVSYLLVPCASYLYGTLLGHAKWGGSETALVHIDAPFSWSTCCKQASQEASKSSRQLW